jgi:hypothetical protein
MDQILDWILSLSYQSKKLASVNIVSWIDKTLHVVLQLSLKLTCFLSAIYAASVSSGSLDVFLYGKNVTNPRNFPTSLNVSKMEINFSFWS